MPRLLEAVALLPQAWRDTVRAMSEENVDVIRRGYAQWMASGEIRVHPDLVWDVSRLGWPGQQTYSGPEGANQFNAEWTGAWDDWELEVEDYVDAGERVVVIVTQRGRSKATGIPVDMRFAHVWSFRDGTAFRMQMYARVDEALEAAGLSEQPRAVTPRPRSRQSESLPFICEWVKGRALLRQGLPDRLTRVGRDQDSGWRVWRLRLPFDTLSPTLRRKRSLHVWSHC